MKGEVIRVSGPTVHVDLKNLKLYERVLVKGLTGEVVQVKKGGAVIQVYEETKGMGKGDPVQGLGTPLSVKLGPGMLSKMYDGLQRPLDSMREKTGPFISPGFGYDSVDRESLPGEEYWPVRIPRPFKRKFPCREPLITGQRIVDFLFPLAKGGTAIIPGGFGTGKTILEQSIAKFADVDIVVYVGCGERGNEMAELLEEFRSLKDPRNDRSLMERTVLVVNTSNMPVAAREASIYTAVTIGEYYRDNGYDVLLLADSISRWAEALREISTSLEEMPGEEGYPTYLASRLSTFTERAGMVESLDGKTGSLSMILSVSPPGGDFTEPVTQALLRNAGVFLMLDTSLAHRRHFPAINWFHSYSLYADTLQDYFDKNVSGEWAILRVRCMELLQKEESLREVSEIVGHSGMQESDRLILQFADRIRNEFLIQNAYTTDADCPLDRTFHIVRNIIAEYDKAVAISGVEK